MAVFFTMVMKKIVFESEFFNIKDTLECGQVFRFKPFKEGYLICSADKTCYAYTVGDKTYIECEEKDENYFINYFDLDRDYKQIYSTAISEGVEYLTCSANSGKGIRILNQDKRETLFSFIVSQNNNIPRIKGILERLCTALGEKKTFLGQEYYTFPSIEKMANLPVEIYSKMGLGYRANYIKNLADDFVRGFNLEEISALDTLKARERLIKIYGVGPKVADCVLLFGLHKTDSFPVDTWIEKIYKQDFLGQLNDRKKIAEYFVQRFKDNSGYFQQYLFYHKRSN